MRRTFALIIAVPAAIAFLAPLQGSPEPSARPSDAVDSGAVVAPPAMTPSALASDDDPQTDTADIATVPDPMAASPAEAAAGDGVGTAEPAPTGPTNPPVESTFVVAPVPEAGGMAGSGPVWRYTVEVEPGLGVDPDQLAAEVRAALHDTRSWARDRTMQQVADPSRARIRVVLAAPSTVDELCGRVGLDTAGIYSCWNGRFAMLNAWRWDAGADGFPDLVTYRTYLVNHEVGHGLGFGHVDCPEPEALAPVMMQQSKGLGACIANGWPYP